MEEIEYVYNKQTVILDNFFNDCFPNDVITDFGSDTIYVTAELNCEIIGISRLVKNFHTHYKTQNNIILNDKIKQVLENSDQGNKFYFLTGIFVDEDYRGNGIAKRLIQERLKFIQEGEYIYTDILKTSVLLDKYYEMGLSEIGEDKNANFMFGLKRTKFNIKDYDEDSINYDLKIDKKDYIAVIPCWYDEPLDFYIPSEKFYRIWRKKPLPLGGG